MLSAVDICNSALIKLGATTIGSLSESSKSARLCNQMYEPLRKKLLRSHRWNFATFRKELAATTNTPDFGYTKEYMLPTDCLRVLGTSIPGNIGWELEHNEDGKSVIVSNYTPMKIKYIKDITDPSDFEPNFSEALAYLIAANIAYSITQSRTLQSDMYQLFRAEVAEARSYDAQEGFVDQVESDEWIDIRG